LELLLTTLLTSSTGPSNGYSAQSLRWTRYPDVVTLDEDGMDAILDLATWAHPEWVRMHPFGNGNSRTAPIWANLLLLRCRATPVPW
jgi:fido (protein-threonine AMPylation protein)